MEILSYVFSSAMIYVVAALVIGFLGCIAMTVAASFGASSRMKKTKKRIMEILPGRNCGNCGYDTCEEYAEAAISGTEEYRKCDLCTSGFNSRISFMWAMPQEKKNEAEH